MHPPVETLETGPAEDGLDLALRAARVDFALSLTCAPWERATARSICVEVVSKSDSEEELGLVLRDAGALGLRPLGADLKLKAQVACPVVIDQYGWQQRILREIIALAVAKPEPRTDTPSIS